MAARAFFSRDAGTGGPRAASSSTGRGLAPAAISPSGAPHTSVHVSPSGQVKLAGVGLVRPEDAGQLRHCVRVGVAAYDQVRTSLIM